MDDTLVTMLGQVLAPLGEERQAQLLALIRKEIAERPLIQYCWDGVMEADANGDGGAWEVGKPSPIANSKTATVFALLHWEDRNAVIAYSVDQEDAADGSGKFFSYYREVIFNPKHIRGPISPEALFIDLMAFLAEPPDDPPGAQHNGAAS
jgi:hypothetical protein